MTTQNIMEFYKYSIGKIQNVMAGVGGGGI